MARKVSLIVIFLVLKPKWPPNHICLMSNGIILLKMSYVSLIIASRGSECENNLQEMMAWESFLISGFDL